MIWILLAFSLILLYATMTRDHDIEELANSVIIFNLILLPLYMGYYLEPKSYVGGYEKWIWCPLIFSFLTCILTDRNRHPLNPVMYIGVCFAAFYFPKYYHYCIIENCWDFKHILGLVILIINWVAHHRFVNIEIKRR